MGKLHLNKLAIIGVALTLAGSLVSNIQQKQDIDEAVDKAIKKREDELNSNYL
jgi:hypothetical protein